ncbi:hypothetical protein M5K25_010348 [Dendrobium thyrsiflorum]|uniref:Pentatricopeptide repeat-containing protein n=1 Tax=Dendrobium thyrsiflorum TaxID=117978 RepID=A0ABD0V057_DENTH
MQLWIQNEHKSAKMEMEREREQKLEVSKGQKEKLKTWIQAMTVLHELVSNGCFPNIFTCNIFLPSLWKEGRTALGEFGNEFLGLVGDRNCVPILNVKSTNKANPTSCSQAARCNVADDFGKLGVDGFLAEIDLIFQDNNRMTLETLDGHPLGKAISPHTKDALKFFCHMQAVSVRTNHYAISATLRSFSDLAVLQLGQQVRGLVLKPGFDSNDFVSSSLIYLYSKCGIIADAKKSFDESCKDGSVTWNSIILGYAQHGLGEIALDLFHEMQEFGVEADHITFVDLFFACSHSGLVKGTKILKSIQPAYGITLRMEHFACGVDIFGRAGMVEEAYRFIIEGMLVGLRPNARAWDALLSRSYCNVESRKIVARCLRDVEPLIKFLPTKADGDKWKHPLSSFQIFDPGGLITTSTCR